VPTAKIAAPSAPTTIAALRRLKVLSVMEASLSLFFAFNLQTISVQAEETRSEYQVQVQTTPRPLIVSIQSMKIRHCCRYNRDRNVTPRTHGGLVCRWIHHKGRSAMIFGRRSLQFGIVAATLLASLVSAAAQSYPSRPIRLIVGFAAGGPTDVLSRIIGGKMSEILGQQIVIENRTGASGNIATQYVVRAPGDGYTILMGSNSNAVNESLFKNLDFNFAKDLIPVAPLAEAPTVLVVHPSLEVRSVKDLINLAKAKPGEIMYATAGKGTTTHLAGELFNLMADVKLIAVPYKSNPAVATA
jgi:hypothetical protein